MEGLKFYIENERKTGERIQSLNNYYSKEIVGQIKQLESKISKKRLCLRTVLPHIGLRYDCVRNRAGNAFRILVMGREALDEKKFSIAARTEQILSTGLKPFSERNPHMKGTTILLKFILKDLCGLKFDQSKEEIIDHCHIFNYFALANWHIHGCFDGSNPKYHYVSMTEIAGKNFIELIKILEPSIAILQGSTIWLNDALNRISVFYDGLHWEHEGNDDFTVFRIRIGNKLMFNAIRFYHPTQRNSKSWTMEDDPYFNKTIIPRLHNIFS